MKNAFMYVTPVNLIRSSAVITPHFDLRLLWGNVKDDARLLGESGNPDEREHSLEARDSGAVGPDEGEYGADRDA